MTEYPQVNDLTQQSELFYSSDSDGESPKGISRRQVLTTGVATAAMLLAFPPMTQAQGLSSNEGKLRSKLGGTTKGAEATSCVVAPQDCASPRLTPPSDPNFPFPELLTSCRNLPNAECGEPSTETFRTLSSDLDVVADYLNPDTYSRHFQIRGTDQPLLPGPTLCIYPGDRIALNVANTLPPNTTETYCPLTDINRPHCLNSMNMHFHGLHVSPLTRAPDGTPVSGDNPEAKLPGAKSSDDVLLTLKPEENQDYCVQLPDFHGPGTHWYHAHVHGTTALDVSNGIVGALIVQDPPGQEILAGAPDVVMVIQEVLPPLKCGDILRGGATPQCSQTPPPFSDQQLYDRAVYNQQAGGNNSAFPEAGTFIVNGQQIPQTLTIKKGEVQRWRLINATGTPRGFMKVQVTNKADQSLQTLYRVAVDGVTLYAAIVNSKFASSAPVMLFGLVRS